MFATETKKHDQRQVRAERAELAFAKDSPETNPLWHSLALRPTGIQAKLTVGQPDDSCEREADCVADKVMSMAPPLQRKCSTCTEEDEEQPLRRKLNTDSDNRVAAETAPPEVRDVLSANGDPLPETTRFFMERRLGFDLSNVRTHTDAAAGSSAQALAARAYTVGHHVVFAPGAFAPQGGEGLRLLAHELTHVVQQNGLASGRGIPGMNPTSNRESYRSGDGAASSPGASPRPITRLSEATIQPQRRRHPRTRRQDHGQPPRRPFNPPEGRWVLVSLRRVGRGAGGRGLVRVYDGTTLRQSFRASGGQPGHTTPVGEFHIDIRDLPHESSEYGRCVHVPQRRERRRSPRRVTTGRRACRADEHYEGADMRFFQRFAPEVGFHRGDPSVVSHGCIHLEDSDAATLWGAVGERTTVFVCAGEGCQWYLDGIRAERTREAQQRRR